MNIPKLKSVWQHKHGSIYIVDAIANERSTNLDKYPVTVVFRNKIADTVWCLPLDSWHNSYTEIKHADVKWDPPKDKSVWRSSIDGRNYTVLGTIFSDEYNTQVVYYHESTGSVQACRLPTWYSDMTPVPTQ